MKKYTKSYVEKLYYSGEDYDFSTDEVDERNIFLIEDDGEMVAFRFYDIVYIYDDLSNVCKATKKNISSWILMRKKYSIKELLEKYVDNEEYLQIIKSMCKRGIKYACEIQKDVFFAVKAQDFTYEELTGQKSRGRK